MKLLHVQFVETGPLGKGFADLAVDIGRGCELGLGRCQYGEMLNGGGEVVFDREGVGVRRHLHPALIC